MSWGAIFKGALKTGIDLAGQKYVAKEQGKQAIKLAEVQATLQERLFRLQNPVLTRAAAPVAVTGVAATSCAALPNADMDSGNYLSGAYWLVSIIAVLLAVAIFKRKG